MAISVLEEGVCAAHIRRAAGDTPEVALLGFFPSDGPVTASQLEKIGRELKLDSYDCTTLLNPNEYQLLTLDTPAVPAEELKAAIRWRLKDMLDFHVNDATIDVMDIPVDKNAPVRNRQMYAVAARNQIIEQKQTLFAQAKIPLKVIDIPEMAQRNISALVEPAGRGLAMLSFNAEGGLLTVTYGGELYLSRHIEARLHLLAGMGETQKTEWFDRITLELQRSLDHFDRQFHFITLSKLMLAPIGDFAEGLQDYLAANLYLPVEPLYLENILGITKTPELRQLESQQRFFLTLGAALRVEEKVL